MQQDLGTSVDKLVFDSPINLEGSWGARNLSEKTQSTMELFFYKTDANYAFIEWCVDELDMVEGIGLTFETDPITQKRTLTDYDGVMTLPDQAMDLLEKHGIDCAEMRKNLAD